MNPTPEEIEAKIKSVLEKDFEIDVSGVTKDTNLFTDLDFDSIDAVDLFVRLQQEIGKQLSVEEFKAIRTMGDAVALVGKYMAG
ncbi:MAG: acyl carrier protein [Kiritimatiellae bacterium]|nr:acyl carrier protein [Kiritimatiellia bacterium]